MYSLYAYEGQRPEDLTFPENAVLLVNPAKDPDGDWLYGTLESTGSAGWVPKAYLDTMNSAYTQIMISQCFY